MNDQINELNTRVKVRIGPSPIHGVGIFAIRDIPKRSVLYADHMATIYTVPYSSFVKLFPEVRALILERWPRVVEGSHFAYPDCRLVAYMNHSDTPNYDAVNDVAIRDITAGEEIFENYRLIPGYAQVFPWLTLDNEKHAKL